MSEVFRGNVPRACLLLLIIAVSEGFGLPVLAESGNAQTTISLVVPPNDSNATEDLSAKGASDVISGQPVYMADTRSSMLEKAGHIIFRVWMSL